MEQRLLDWNQKLRDESHLGDSSSLGLVSRQRTLFPPLLKRFCFFNQTQENFEDRLEAGALKRKIQMKLLGAVKLREITSNGLEESTHLCFKTRGLPYTRVKSIRPVFFGFSRKDSTGALVAFLPIFFGSGLQHDFIQRDPISLAPCHPL